MTTKFKAGDKVVRINNDFYNLKVGDNGTVLVSWNDYDGDEIIKLLGNDGQYYARNFKLVEEPPTFKAMKFRVESPEQSKEIQEALFSMGYEWASGCTKVQSPYDAIYIETKGNGKIVYRHVEPDEDVQEYTIKTIKSYEIVAVEIPEETIELMGQKYSKKELEDALRSLKPVN